MYAPNVITNVDVHIFITEAYLLNNSDVIC